MKVSRNCGLLTLGIYLLLIGLVQVFGIRLGDFGIAVPILAIVAGLLLILGK